MFRATLAGLLVFLYRQETVAFSEFLGEVILARPVGDALCPPARLGLDFPSCFQQRALHFWSCF